MKCLTKALAWQGRSTYVALELTEDDLARRDKLLARLVGDRLVECRAQAWALSAEEKAAVLPLSSTLQHSKSLRSVTPGQIEAAILVADATRLRIGR
jgi:hypothetical protein